MVTLALLVFFFILTAVGYTLFAAMSFDRLELPWFPFPRVEPDHWTITLLKVVPTYLNLMIACHAFDFGWHYFTVGYALYIAIGGVGDWVIFRNANAGIVIFGLSHLISETVVLALLWEVGAPWWDVLLFLCLPVVLLLFLRYVLAGGTLDGSMKAVIVFYGALLTISMSSYLGLAFGEGGFPWTLRLTFALTPFAVTAVDGLYTINQYRRPVSQIWILGAYYLAIFLMSLNMIQLSKTSVVQGDALVTPLGQAAALGSPLHSAAP